MANIQSKSNKTCEKALASVIFAIYVLGGFAAAASAKESDITASLVIKLVNEARKEADVEILTENPKLKAAAENKAQDMINRDYFAHISPLGESPWDLIVGQGYDYRFAGENLAIDYTSAKQQQQAWMESPLHRKNILNPEYKEIGVAVKSGTIDGRRTTVTVQEFGAQMAELTAQSSAAKKELLPSKSVVAGVSMRSPAGPVSAPAAIYPTVSRQLRLGEIFADNKLTLAGWVSVFAVGILITMIDMTILAYKKHKQALFVHEIGSK